MIALAMAGVLGIALGALLILSPERTTRTKSAPQITFNKEHLTALAAGFVLWAITGWMIWILMAPLFFFILRPILFKPADPTLASEAINGWLAGLSASLSAGRVLEQAIKESVTNADPIIRESVAKTAHALHQGRPITEALSEIRRAHPESEEPLLLLEVAATHRGPGLVQGLTHTRVAADQNNSMIREAMAAQEGPRTVARTVTGLVLGSVILMARSESFAPYQTPQGQITAAALLGIYLALLVLLGRRMAPPRKSPLTESVSPS